MECKKNRHIWIMNHYAGNMLFDKGGRHYSFAKYLRRFGDEPVIFCCNAVHNGTGLFFQDDSLWHVHMAEEIQVPFVYVKGRSYAGNGFGRVLNIIDFYRNVQTAAKAYVAQNGKPDIIYASSPHLLTLVAGIRLAKWFRVKCICEVRDLWPESLVAFGIMNRYNPSIFAMRRMEKWIYRNTDALIFTLGGAYEYIREQGWTKEIPMTKVHYINNGVDLELFDRNQENFGIDDIDLQNKESFKVIYTGSIRRANNLGKLIDAAKKVKNLRIKFLVWGQGEDLDGLRKRVEEENVSNVGFKGYVDKKYIPYIVGQADLALVHYGDMPVGRFGVSPNKLFDYMAAGKPILDDRPCNYNPLVECDVGIEVKNPTPENIAKAIEDFANMDKETYERYCQNARKGAEKYDFKNLTQKLLQIMTGELY